MRRNPVFSLLLRAPAILAATLAIGCGDDTTGTGSTSGGGGDGEGGESGEVSSSSGDPTSSSSGNPTSTSSGGDPTSSSSSGGPACGDENVDPGEECDDGNTVDRDGCSGECLLEVKPGCGNGVVEADLDEVCDDGNDDGFDGCENDCTPSPEEFECERLAPLGGGGCEVDPGNDAKLLIGDVLTSFTVLRGGQVAIGDDGVISCVGCDCEGVEAGATVVTCPEGAISPGLINTHEHITYAHNDPANDSGERYEHRHDWREGNNGHTAIPYDQPLDGDARDQAVRWGELRFLLSGATSLVGSGSATGFLRNLDRNDNEGLPVPAVHFETFPLGDADGTTAESGCGEYDIDSQQSIALDLAYLPHVSEGIDQSARNEFVCVSGSPGQDLLENHSSFIHAIGLIPADYADMASEGTSLIWSPRSNIVLYGNTATVTAAAREGVNIALGTDWIISGSHNMFRELACAASLNDTYYDGFFTRRDLWRMVTAGAARSLGLEKVIGTLAVGTVADIAIFDGSTLDAHAAVVDGDIEGVHLVLRGGAPLYGDASLVDVLPDTPAGCDDFDGCGVDKILCVESEIGMSYAEFVADTGLYGPVFCDGPPADEPSCLPTRPEAVDGSTIYSGVPGGGDADGDGIDDGDDNCPSVFNPVRPIDDGAQGDEDGDDVGDACDPCPREADVEACTGVDPADEDSDGIPSFYDNCPFEPNTTQADNDGDDKGNACDACPEDANPGFSACATTIYSIKTGDVEGVVSLADVLVTACSEGNGFFVQHVEGDAAFEGPENSGVYVYDPGVVCGNDVTAGDRIQLDATTSVFFDQIQLGFATYTINSSGEASPDPVVLTAAEASGTQPNEWEGVLARVEGVTVTDNAPAPGPGDGAPTGEFEVEGTLRVDNFVFEAMPVAAEGIAFASITGVLNYKNGNQKIEPRDAADLDQ